MEKKPNWQRARKSKQASNGITKHLAYTYQRNDKWADKPKINGWKLLAFCLVKFFVLFSICFALHYSISGSMCFYLSVAYESQQVRTSFGEQGSLEFVYQEFK